MSAASPAPGGAPPRAAAPGLIERARALAAGTLVASPPRAASTVVLLRDGGSAGGGAGGGGGLEVHLQRRASTMAFAAGAYVFPGGRVDPADFPPSGGAPDGVPRLPEAWVRVLAPGEPDLAAALVVAAVRETFEEAGVLLAEDLPPDVAADLGAARGRSFVDLAVAPSTRLLAPWARWVTPEVEPRRYDTRFFVAALPRGQTAAVDAGDTTAGGEADAVLWLPPGEALARHRDGEMFLMPPTSFTLGELTEYADTAAVLAAAAARDCRPVLPRVLVDGDNLRFLVDAAT